MPGKWTPERRAKLRATLARKRAAATSEPAPKHRDGADTIEHPNQLTQEIMLEIDAMVEARVRMQRLVERLLNRGA